MRKVFRYFEKHILMNSKIAISVIISAIIVVVGIFAITSQESETIKIENTLNKELQSTDEITPEIQKKLDEIEKVNSENKYSPKDREWITSGPFQIDRSEYVLGEKIFLRTAGLEFNEKGETVFLRPLNSTHYSVYFTIPFDGSDNAAYNYYLEPQLSKIKGYCTVDDLIGEWRAVFRGTNYPNLEFKITEQILPGAEGSFEPVC